MKSIWSEFTIVRFCFALMLGIGLQIWTDYSLNVSAEVFAVALPLACLAVTTIVLYRFLTLELQFKFRYLSGVTVNFVMICMGFLIAWLHSEKNYPQHFSNYISKNSVFELVISEPPVQKERTINISGEIRSVVNDLKQHRTIGKILLSVNKDSSSEKLSYGDVIVFKTTPVAFEEPKNPGEFSFKLYKSFHNVYHRAFLRKNDWKLSASYGGNLFFDAVYKLRETFLESIKVHVTDRNDFGVATAIMLGYRDYINDDIVKAYSSSGALHVLSVSGLHLATMFFMLNYVFGWMEGRGRKLIVTKSIIILIFIWFYTCLTGLSPSVLRAAMMFSLMQVAKLTFRRVDMFNILAGSAVVLMIFDPFIITEIGFRLSYLAVLGIVYLHPKISGLIVIASDKAPQFKKAQWFLKPVVFLRHDLFWFFRYSVTDFVWQLTSVSIAAQLATAPIGLYYFHQFPVLFFISNWVVIPVGNLILFSGTLLFAIGWLPHFGTFVGAMFNRLLHLLNEFIFWVEKVPNSLIERISITMIEMMLIYVALLMLSLMTEYALKRYRPTFALVFLAISLGLLTWNAVEVIETPLQKQLIVYHVPKQSAIAFIDGNKASFLFDKKLLHDYSSMLFHVKHNIWEKNIKEEKESTEEDFIKLPIGKLTELNGKRILIVDTIIGKTKTDITNKLKVDIVVFSKNPKVYMESFQKLVDADEYVFDTSNKEWKVKYWKQDCERMGLQYWDVTEKGAFEKSFYL